MWPFKKKKVKNIDGPPWGHLLREYQMDVDTLSRMRCVKQDGVNEKRQPVTFLRMFKPEEAEQKGIEITGWKTFDKYPELIHFEGYEGKNTKEEHLEDKNT